MCPVQISFHILSRAISSLPVDKPLCMPLHVADDTPSSFVLSPISRNHSLRDQQQPNCQIQRPYHGPAFFTVQMDHTSWGIVETSVSPARGLLCPLSFALPPNPLQFTEAAVTLSGPRESTECVCLSLGLPVHRGAVSPHGTICAPS